MTDMRDLYQEMLLDHYRHPRNHGALPAANGEAEGDNPLCGDRVQVSVNIEDGRIRDIAFAGTGCAISTASASLMTEAVKGKTLAEAQRLFDEVHGALAGDGAALGAPGSELEPLACLAGVREYPMRVKCATLAWHTLRAALDHGRTKVSTE